MGVYCFSGRILILIETEKMNNYHTIHEKNGQF